MKRAILLLLSMATVLTLLCECSKKAEETSWFRKVAREVREDGWVYTFVYEDNVSDLIDDRDLIQYSFYGINIRYKYDENYVQKIVHEPESPDKGTAVTEILYPTVLIAGRGPAAEQRDIAFINGTLLDKSQSVEDLLALDPEDYEFESIDKEMFFRLMRQALTAEPQKEGRLSENGELTYWDLPSWAMLEEPEYLDGYKFQVAFLNKTGCVDVLYIDVLYKTGDGYTDYVQLSDLVENGTATDGQKQAFDTIRKLVPEIEESESFVADADSYMDAEIGGLDFFRLYTFLKDLDQVENYGRYLAPIQSEVVEGVVE